MKHKVQRLLALFCLWSNNICPRHGENTRVWRCYLNHKRRRGCTQCIIDRVNKKYERDRAKRRKRDAKIFRAHEILGTFTTKH